MPSDEPNSKRGIIAAACAVVLVGAIVAFALFSQAPTSTTQRSATALASPAPSAIQFPPPPSQTPQRSATVLPTAPLPRASAPPLPLSEAEVPPWATQIDNVLRSSTNESQSAQILLQMLPTLPEDGQIEVANHITNLLPDADYNRLKPVLLNPATSEPVLAVFFTDLMNRDDPTKLRTFLDLAKVPNHPYREEALSDLQIYVGEDYGTNWAQWSTAIEQYLKASNAGAAP